MYAYLFILVFIVIVIVAVIVLPLVILQVFQKRYDGSVDFYTGWESYKCGFGSLNGEFWLGMEIKDLRTNAFLYLFNC